ncbi:hypothetical protein V6N12_066028 [Hibiscus sabdariffa]|uniref:RNase H type-1 domain-containing protein n=1 Tax=Hibiscus sabdariffa TaxID=183260 RepID=A0ABR2ASW7_9ROSI
MTNTERSRCHFTNVTHCPLCLHSLEDVEHLFHKFPHSALIWSAVIRTEKLDEFLSLPIHEWILRNLSDNFTFAIDCLNWDVLFGTILWNILCNRNVVIFDNSGEGVASILEKSRRLTLSCCSATTSRPTTDTGTRVHRGERDGAASALVTSASSVDSKWLRPEECWIKLNTDGSCEGDQGHATCGGVARDSSDCLEMVRLLSMGHVRHDGNKVADPLCRYASSLDFEVHIIDTPTEDLDQFLLANNG